ncbi:MAG: DUF1330 domain-containing protein [Actinomycetota bacterium]
MAAYLIARIDVTDPGRYGEYTKHTPRIIADHGGRFVARGGTVTTLEGEPETRRVVVLEFPSVEAAQAFYDSDDYGMAKAIRAGAAEGQFIIVDEMADADWRSAVAASRQHSF